MQNRVVEGLIPRSCKIRKRGCSSSSSSVLQNYQFKRAILVGKPPGSRSSTPVPSWRTTAAALDSRKYAPSQSGGGRSKPVSARKLISTFLHACEGDAVTKLTNEKIPYFNAPIYLQNKTQIGKVEEIFGPINEFRLYVEDMRSTRRGNCRSMKEEIGKHVDVTTKLSSQLFLSPNIRHSSEMKHFGGSDTEAYSQHFEKRILKLEDNSNPRSDDRCSTTKIVKSHCTTEEV
ncbi:unnamed protein product [Camellia sinensis]